MSKIEMPRFTRRYPTLTDSVLRQMMEYTREFELEMLKKQEEAFKDQQKQEQEKQQQNEEQQTQQSDEGNESQESSDASNSSQSEQDSNSGEGSEGGESSDSKEGSEGGQSSLEVRLAVIRLRCQEAAGACHLQGNPMLDTHTAFVPCSSLSLPQSETIPNLSKLIASAALMG